MVSDKNMLKGIIYGANYLARPLGDLCKSGLKLGHPFSAMGFAAWDLVAENYQPLKDNIANKAVKAGGLLYFGFLTGKNLVEIAQSNYENLKDLPFNASMAYNFAADLKELF